MVFVEHIGQIRAALDGVLIAGLLLGFFVGMAFGAPERRERSPGPKTAFGAFADPARAALGVLAGFRISAKSAKSAALAAPFDAGAFGNGLGALAAGAGEFGNHFFHGEIRWKVCPREGCAAPVRV